MQVTRTAFKSLAYGAVRMYAAHMTALSTIKHPNVLDAAGEKLGRELARRGITPETLR